MLYLHVLLMFVAFALTAGTGIMMALIADSAEPRAVAVAARVLRPLSAVGGVSLLLGLIVGFGIASKLDYPLSATWLVVTYICVAVILVFGFGCTGRGARACAPQRRRTTRRRSRRSLGSLCRAPAARSPASCGS